MARQKAYFPNVDALLPSENQCYCMRAMLYCVPLYNERIVQKEMLQKIHSGQQGVERCRARVATSVWWPGLLTMFKRWPRVVKSVRRRVYKGKSL